MGEGGSEEMLEQVIRKKIWAGRYRCKWHPDVIGYVPAGQMPSFGMTLSFLPTDTSIKGCLAIINLDFTSAAPRQTLSQILQKLRNLHPS
jgi:hypothetical protein